MNISSLLLSFNLHCCILLVEVYTFEIPAPQANRTNNSRSFKGVGTALYSPPAMNLLYLIWCIIAIAQNHAMANDSSTYQGTKKRTQERGLYWEFEPYSSVDPKEVKEIHVVFSNHMDVG